MPERLMVTFIVLIGLGVLWLGWQLVKRGFVKTIQPVHPSTGKPTLLYFSADYCVPCKAQQTPIIERLAVRLTETVEIKKYDVTRFPDLAGQYKILSVPATVILDGAGQVKNVNFGVTDLARLEKQLFSASGTLAENRLPLPVNSSGVF